MAKANEDQGASDQLGEYRALGSDASFDRLVYDGGEFGYDALSDDDGELDFLGIPGAARPRPGRRAAAHVAGQASQGQGQGRRGARGRRRVREAQRAAPRAARPGRRVAPPHGRAARRDAQPAPVSSAAGRRRRRPRRRSCRSASTRSAPGRSRPPANRTTATLAGVTSTMALRTRVFAALLRLSEKGIEEVVDLPAHRAKRVKLQRTFAGRLVFGRADNERRGRGDHGRQRVPGARPPAGGRDRPVAVRPQLPRRRLGAGQPRAVRLAGEPDRGAQPRRRDLAVVPAGAGAAVPGRRRGLLGGAGLDRRARRRAGHRPAAHRGDGRQRAGATSRRSWRCWPGMPAAPSSARRC